MKTTYGSATGFLYVQAMDVQKAITVTFAIAACVLDLGSRDASKMLNGCDGIVFW